MMKLLHTPEGVRDIYGNEYARKLWVEGVIKKQLNSYGYMDIMTPTFEYFDVFAREIGTTPSKDLFKMIDGDGNTLVLRPDFTPGVARCAAKYFGDTDTPLRFCYHGNTYTNTSSLQGKLKEVTQMGVELIGDDSIHAEAETIALAIEALLAAGLLEFQISIGEVEYFKGICEAAGIDAQMEAKLRDLISEKNIFGVEEVLLEAGADDKSREQLLRITDLLGTQEILAQASEEAGNQRSQAAVLRLCELYKVLGEYGVDKYVAFDLGMLSHYNYYTGIIFKCYAYGVGDVIAKGGRYDNLLEQFGEKKAAVGFAFTIDALMAALYRQRVLIKETATDTVEYSHDFADQLNAVKERRRAGEQVALNPGKATEDQR
ncbi:MAG: ATP phosphoribosyltransferase regulatory subunit [Lachnospiraceae bacterium]|jgi:ATP phosphoribosyltransferase regulatory subunit|nr:ATP phosphoribosyltransferase regulatory subunit [Lachnospiraceae bacterium]